MCGSFPRPIRAAFRASSAAGFAKAVRDAIAAMQADGIRLAGLIADSIFSSDGVFADPPGFLAPAVKAVRKAGGLFIADEVQPGFGRTGAGMWGFARHGVVPDIVTMGKPMGNGYPLAGLVTRPELLSAFAEDFGYFNTFAASPAGAAAGLAVLEVIDGGRADRERRAGRRSFARVPDGAGRPLSGHQRGARRGALSGRRVSGGADLSAPAPDLAATMINGLRERGILIGAAGRFGNVLKIRPPLCVTTDHADELVGRWRTSWRGFVRARSLFQQSMSSRRRGMDAGLRRENATKQRIRAAPVQSERERLWTLRRFTHAKMNFAR